MGFVHIMVFPQFVRTARDLYLDTWGWEWYVIPANADLTVSVAAENSMMPNMGMNPAAQQPNMVGQDPDKLFQAEAENLELVQHEWILEGIEERLLKTHF